MSILLFAAAAASDHGDGLQERLTSALDWAGRVGVLGAVAGFALGYELRRLGYKKIRRQARRVLVLPPAPLEFSGYWGLTGMIIGFILGLIRG